MKNIKLGLFLIIGLIAACTTAKINQSPTANNPQKPNIILILADDLGYMDCGFTGSKTFETPNLDALAQKGMVFKNAYAGAGNCAPSRACLLSGQYSPRHGVYAVGSTTRGDIPKMRVVPVKNNPKLNSEIVTIAEALKNQGYTTALYGKWHLGKDVEHTPKAQGFDDYLDTRADNPNKKETNPTTQKAFIRSRKRR